MSEDVGSLVVRVAMENSSFQQGAANLNRQLRVIQSDFKNATSGIKDHGNSIDALKAKKEMLSKSISTQSQLVQTYKNRLDYNKTTLDQTAEKQVKLNEKISAAEKAYEESKNALGANAEETKKLKQELDGLRAEHSRNEETIRRSSKEIDNYTIKVNNAENKLKNMQSELDKTNNSLSLHENKWTQLSVKLESIGSKFTQIADKMGSIGKKLTTTISVPLAAIGGLSTKVGMEFEASMSQVQAISGASANELKQLEGSARAAGASTSKSAKDAADALGYMALAGWDTKTSMDALMPVLRLSEAANLDLGRTSDLVTDSMSSLGISVKELPTYLDQVAKTAASSNTNIDALMEAMVVSGGTFKNLNVPLSEANALLGVLANRGIKGLIKWVA